jgi:hypothetical protein
MDQDTRTDFSGPRKQAIGAAIAEHRRIMKGWGRAELGLALGGVPERTVARWETGAADLSLEQALGIEEALGLPRGTLGAAGTYFGFQAEPFSFEGEAGSHYFTTDEEMRDALDAAMTLGMGIRLRNQMTPDPDPLYADKGAYVEEWVLDLTQGAPLTDEPFDL